MHQLNADLLASLECKEMKMKQSDFFTWEVNQEKVATLTLNRPEIHNAFNDQMIADLTALFEEKELINSCRLIVMRGAGKSFCAGADLNWMKAMKDYSMQENVDDSLKLQKMFDVINNCPVPTVGVVHGAALGGGSGLVSCLDYVIAEENTKFGFTEVKLGLLPAVISPYVVDKIGFSQARALFTTGERFMASRAMQIGLVHRVEEQASLEVRVAKVIAQYLSAGPEASSVAKALAFHIAKADQSFEAKSQYTRELIAKTRIGSEAQEGMTAMLEKRKAGWCE